MTLFAIFASVLPIGAIIISVFMMQRLFSDMNDNSQKKR